MLFLYRTDLSFLAKRLFCAIVLRKQKGQIAELEAKLKTHESELSKKDKELKDERA